MERKRIYLMILLLGICLLTACGKENDSLENPNNTQSVKDIVLSEALDTNENTETDSSEKENGTSSQDGMTVVMEEASCVNPEGQSLETRIVPPDGYVRPDAEEGSLLEFMRKYPVKENGSTVLL